jgi:hypothetical protein
MRHGSKYACPSSGELLRFHAGGVFDDLLGRLVRIHRHEILYANLPAGQVVPRIIGHRDARSRLREVAQFETELRVLTSRITYHYRVERQAR